MFKISALFVVLCAISASSVEAASRRGLRDVCADACAAVMRTDGDTLTNMIMAGGFDFCTCTCGSNGDTLLHTAVPSQCIVCANALIQKAYCPVDPVNFYGETPLHVASSICQSPMLNVLLNFGADESRQDSAYNTPLCRAAMTGNPNCGGIVNDLVRNGADICETCNGLTPLQKCDDSTTSVVCDVIVQNGGDEC